MKIKDISSIPIGLRDATNSYFLETKSLQMKTIFVIYTNAFVSDKAILRQKKYYSFNTISDVKVGDMLKTNKYDSLLQVVEVLDKCFLYYNTKTGELSNDIYSSEQREIVELEVIDEKENEIVYANKVNSHD